MSGIAIGVGTAVAGVASAGAAIYGSTKSAGIANAELGMAETTFNEQQGYASQLQQLINNPSSVTSLPGYQFQFNQGSQAVARQMAASGFGGSTNEADALTQFGQGLASSFYQQQSSLLASLSGLTSPSSPAQLGSVASSAQASSNSQLNSALASLGVLGGLAAGSFGSAGSPSAKSSGGFTPDQWATSNGGQTTSAGVTLA